VSNRRPAIRLFLSIGTIGVAALVLSCSDAGRTPSSGGISVEHTATGIRVSSAATVLDVNRAPYGLTLRDAGGGTVLASEADGGGVFYERGGVEQRLGNVLSDRTLDDGVELVVATSEGASARATIRFVTERTIEVRIEPPAPDTIDALGDRWHSPADERIYGLTERLRDSPLVAPGVIDNPREDFATIRSCSRSASRPATHPTAGPCASTSSTVPATRPSSTSTQHSPDVRSCRPTGRS